MAAAKSSPKDAQVMAAILKDMGIIDYEPRVLNQMLEFTYRYVTSILDDAQLFSSHAKKKGLDVEDVRLAIQLQMDKYFTTPPPRELLLEIARQKNSVALPLIKATPGPRLPPDRYSLTACNYRLKSTIKKARTGSSASRLSIAPLQPNSSVSKGTPAVSLSSKTGATLSVVTKAVASPTVTIVSRTNTNTTVPKTTPTPIIKFSEANRTVGPVTTTAVTTPVISSLPTSQNNAPTTGNVVEQQPTSEINNKRKRDDDPDDYDVE